jgi:hypothetical protein
VQGHDLIPLSGVFEGALISRLDSDTVMLAINTLWPTGRPGVDLNAAITVDSLDLQIGYA